MSTILLRLARFDAFRRNLQRADPSLRGRALDKAVVQVFRSYARYWVESFRLPGTSAADLDSLTETEIVHDGQRKKDLTIIWVGKNEGPFQLVAGPDGMEGLVLNFPVPGGQAQIERPKSAGEDDLKRFISVVLATTEDSWTQTFRQLGARYREPKLVLFSGAVRSACGTGMAAMGPFYCPADEKVYIDLDFYRELKNRFRAPGDFAQAYVVAHEVGHHVQNLTGAMEGFQGYGASGPGSSAVRLELQADCYAGVWAHDQRGRGYLEAGDMQEAMNAAAAIGDDALQRRSGGVVVPESFTHGTSEQRARWFRNGFETGDPAACDTFEARAL